MTHLAVILSLTTGCKEKPTNSDEVDSPLRALVQSAQTPLAASTAIREANFESCQDMLAALYSLDARPKSQRFSVRESIGLIGETLAAARSVCPKKDQESALVKTRRSTTSDIALSLIVVDPQVALARLKDSGASALVLRRRAQLHFASDEHEEGLDALVASLRFEDDEETRVRASRLLTLAGDGAAALKLIDGRDTAAFGLPRAGALAALGRYRDSISLIDAAPLHLRQDLANEVARHAKSPAALAEESLAGPELLLALHNRMSKTLADRGVALLQRATLLRPEDGEAWIILAETLEAITRPVDAVAAWDQAAAHSPGAERPILAPIRILREEGQLKEARSRAAELTEQARSATSSRPESLRLASLAYRYAGESKRAVALAEEALQSRAGDGRLTAELATRLEEDAQPERAARLLSTLLVCGSRGHAWHRHEIAARLTLLIGSEGLKSYIEDTAKTCQIVDAENLWQEVRSVP